jgi:hypothetical protein
VDNSPGFQFAYGTTDRNAADPVALAELALGGDHLAWFEQAIGNLRQKVLFYAPVERYFAGPVQHCLIRVA